MTQLVHIAVVAALTFLVYTGHLEPETGVAYIVGAVLSSPVAAIRSARARKQQSEIERRLAELDPRSSPDA